MPTIVPGDKVLVSGANGYVAMWVVRTLLEQGYAVRGTVRSAEKGRYLSELFNKDYSGKFELIIVEDITKDGAFDEAVKGVDGIAHTASPFHLKADDPQELIVPAVNGTVGILQSAMKYGPSVKRIVVTSSCAAVQEIDPKPRVFSELDWNNQSVRAVEENGRDALPGVKYRASKTLAEKAAWDFHAQNKDKVSWDMSVLNPPYVFGPAIHEVNSLSSLNESLRQLYDTIFDESTSEARHKEASAWVDVRDIAEAHVRALKEEKAGGERIIISANSFLWQEWVNAARGLNPSLPPGHPHVVPKSYSEYLVRYDASKAARILNIASRGAETSKTAKSEVRYYKSIEETTKDMLDYFKTKGW